MSFQAAATNCPPNSSNPNCYPDVEYPGYVPDWTQRFTVGCSMVNNETGAEQAMFSHGNMDYAQGGSMFVYLNDAVRQWYADLRELAEQGGEIDMRLIPDPDSALSNFIEIERNLADQ